MIAKNKYVSIEILGMMFNVFNILTKKRMQHLCMAVFHLYYENLENYALFRLSEVVLKAMANHYITQIV